MRHIIDLCDLTEKEFSDLYKLVSNIIDRPEGYVDEVLLYPGSLGG